MMKISKITFKLDFITRALKKLLLSVFCIFGFASNAAMFYSTEVAFRYVPYESQAQLIDVCVEMMSEFPIESDPFEVCVVNNNFHNLPLSINQCRLNQDAHPAIKAGCHCSNEGFRYFGYGMTGNDPYSVSDGNYQTDQYLGMVCIAEAQIVCPSDYFFDPLTGFCKEKCDCNELKIDGECVEMPVDSSIDWLDSNALYLFPDNNHDDAPRCEPQPLDEVDACPSRGNSTQVGNPIDCASGRKIQTETDYRGFGIDPITYQRTYRSPEPASTDDPSTGNAASGWINAGTPNFSITTYEDGSQLAYFSVGEWYRRAFYRESSTQDWQSNPNLPNVSVSPQGGGTRITMQQGRSFELNASGQVEQSFDRQHLRYSYEYTEVSGTPKVSEVRNRAGETLSYTYEGPNGSLSQITDQDGLSIHYRYDVQGNLTEVIYPDNSPEYLADNPRKVYLFEHPDFPHHLTGIVDEAGNRFATFAYDEDGRAIRTEHADGAERVEVEYPADGEAVVRFYQDGDSGLYREEHYTYGVFRGAHHMTSKAITLCHGCATGTETWDYNPDGLLVRHTSPGGQITEWNHDTQGRVVAETVAERTPDARTTTYVWHTDWNQLERVETDTEITSYVYDDDGQLVETTITPKD